MGYWIYCSDDSTHDGVKHKDQVVTLCRNAKSTSLYGAYTHIFSSANLALVDMDNLINRDDIARLELFIKQHLFTDFASEMAGQVSYLDVYFAANRKSNEPKLAQDFFSALGVSGGIIRGPDSEQLIIPDLEALQYMNSCARQLPKNVWFHGSREELPIENFEHGHYAAQVGFSGFGTVDVERHAFFFSSDPRMSESFGSVHAYTINAARVLDITNDLSEEDADLIRRAGFSPESIDRMYEKWELFDGENGKEFCDRMLSLGYDAVRYSEVDQNGVMRECMAALTSSIINHVTPDYALVRNRVNALSLVDAWRNMYSENRGKLSSEQLEKTLRAMGNDANLQAPTAFYEKVERALRDYDYTTVLQHVTAFVVKDLDVRAITLDNSPTPHPGNERKVSPCS